MSLPAPYKESERSIWLTVDPGPFSAFPDEIAWNGQKLLKKSEFHVTLLRLNPVGDKDRTVNFFKDFSAQNPLQLISFRNDFRYAEENEDKTIVVRCTVSNLQELYEELNRDFGSAVPVQPAHVTLYCLQKNVGIHIGSDEKMESLERVRLPELEAALSKIQRAT